jgi:hypothetical protein
MKSRSMEETELTMKKWMTIKEYYSRTKFRFKDNTELVLDIENNYIEVEGLCISTEVLIAVVQKINEEKD